MNKIELPEKATKENASNLIEIGSHLLDIKSKYKFLDKKHIYLLKDFGDFIFRCYLSLGILILLMAPPILLLMGQYAKTPISELPQSILWFLIIYLILVSTLSFYLGISKGKKLYNWVTYKFFKFPKPEYEVFNVLSILSKKLLEGNRREAVKKLPSLRERLEKYIEVNNDLKEYLTPELSIFKETNSLGRLILYSEKSETELSCYFLDLGLSLIHKKFAVLYSKTEALRRDIKKFGVIQPTNKFERFINFLKMTEYLKNLLIIIVVIVSFILWLIYGAKFTFPSF